MFPTWCRWPVLGLFLLFGLFAHLGFGFGCERTEPGVTTDPGTPAEAQSEVQSVAAPEPSRSSIAAAFAIIPLAGGAAVALLSRRRDA